MWFETPVMSTDIEATLQVARSISIPVAAGERSKRLSDILRLVADRSISIVQPETLAHRRHLGSHESRRHRRIGRGVRGPAPGARAR